MPISIEELSDRAEIDPNGEVVDVIRYTDMSGYGRRCYRLQRHGCSSREYETPDELGKVVDLAALVEEELQNRETRVPNYY